MYSIYLITNQVNGKVYVGQTKNTVKSRWSGHCYFARTGRDDGHFYRAIRRYGEDSFDITTLITVETKAQADKFEKIWIILLQASNKEYGYVSTLDGQGRSGANPESKQRKSIAQKGLRRTPETCARMKASRKKLFDSGYKVKWFREDIMDAEIKTLYLNGLDQRAIAEKFHCTQPSIGKRLRRMGFHRLPGKKRAELLAA